MLGLARYLNLDIDCLAKSLLQLLTSITNRTTVNIHDESQTKIWRVPNPLPNLDNVWRRAQNRRLTQ